MRSSVRFEHQPLAVMTGETGPARHAGAFSRGCRRQDVAFAR